MPQVITKLQEDHQRMVTLLDLMEEKIKHFSEGADLDYFLVETVLDYMMNFPDLCHHPIENIILARMKEKNPELAKTYENLLKEHEELGELLRRFNAAVKASELDVTVPRDALISIAEKYCSTLHHHMKNEETAFFPAAQKALDQQDWEEIEKRMIDKEDPLFGREANREYKALHKVIVDWGMSKQDQF